SIRKKFYSIFKVRIGKNSRIALGTILLSPEKIEIGNNTIINENCHLDGRGNLKIGDNCSISFSVSIITASHMLNSETFEYYEKATYIKDNVWIGANAIILDGTILENQVVIGAGAVIKGFTEPSGVYIGNPAQLIKMRKKNLKYEIDYKPFFK
ncbi:DapH/DapD/GlmU-related protein, partial [uncultured Dubosiella sp.]